MKKHQKPPPIKSKQRTPSSTETETETATDIAFLHELQPTDPLTLNAPSKLAVEFKNGLAGITATRLVPISRGPGS
ncbi:MAG: hypothetical protein ACJAQT_001403 [Akkermansiaceae bacterium]|jgi:hypothetical protein